MPNAKKTTTKKKTAPKKKAPVKKATAKKAPIKKAPTAEVKAAAPAPVKKKDSKGSKVKFLKSPTGAFGLGYSAGDIVELKNKKLVADMIAAGYCEEV